MVRKSIPSIIVILLLSLVLQPACDTPTEGQSADRFSWESFPQVDSLEEEHMRLTVEGQPHLTFVNDRYVIVSKFTGNTILDVFDKATGEKITELLHFGRGPLELVAVGDLWEDANGQLYAYDLTTGRVLRLPEFSPYDATQAPVQILTLRGLFQNIYSIQAGLAPGTFIASSSAHGDGRYFKFDTTLDTLIRVGQLPPPPGDWPTDRLVPHNDANAMALQSYLARHPAHNWVVVANVFKDYFALYKGDSLAVEKWGPNNYAPVLNFWDAPNGVRVPIIAPDTKQTYDNVYTSARRFYIPYFGEVHHKGTCQDILVFDWEGEPVGHIVLPYRLSPVAVYENAAQEVEVWGIHPKLGELVKFTSNLFQTPDE